MVGEKRARNIYIGGHLRRGVVNTVPNEMGVFSEVLPLPSSMQFFFDENVFNTTRRTSLP